VAGLASAGLLAASIRWAHHWGPLADALLAGWGAATIAALMLSGMALKAPGPPRLSAKLGLGLAGVSFLALAVAGIAAAAGADPAGACGGG
jgi:hypothetical protein